MVAELIVAALMLHFGVLLAIGNFPIGCTQEWCKNVILTNQTDGFTDVVCTVAYPGNVTHPANAPWFYTVLYYAIYASAAIFVLITGGKFIRFAVISFGMFWVAIPFVSYGCTYGGVTTSLMPGYNIVVPVIVMIMSIIATILWD